ncbi:hypothetical protein [Rhizobium sp. Root482]|uniref:hypothetical protein n=1 Tax=Rhizobium sp. Root482 TaxID=1736543 RepID=UPI0006F84759|nr:hypothetical protein [Rhizobium sp. Root482]KQY26640.1 hypothetical protein ASD31_00020 [Rhizobium sp. Root482]
MASPWKFLARLVSPRRQHKHDDGLIKDERQDASAIPTAPVEGGLSTAEQSTREKVRSLARSKPVSAECESTAKSGTDRQGTEESDNAPSAETFELASQDIGTTLAYAAPRVEDHAHAQPAKKRGRAKSIKAGAIVSQTSPAVPTISDEMSLEQEIRSLRDQLASKLRLQNSQLKQMLKRFDR